VSVLDDEYSRATLALAQDIETYFTLVRGRRGRGVEGG
jgi:hypothetical protein